MTEPQPQTYPDPDWSELTELRLELAETLEMGNHLRELFGRIEERQRMDQADYDQLQKHVRQAHHSLRDGRRLVWRLLHPPLS